MRTNLEHNLIQSARFLNASHGVVRFDLTGSFRIPGDGPTMYFLDPGASTRTVFLPSITPYAGQEYFVANLGAALHLDVVTAEGVAVRSLVGGETGVFISYRSGWRSVLGPSAAALDLLNEMLGWTRQVVTTATAVVAATDSEVVVNRAGAVTLTLPDAETWYAAHDLLTSFLLVQDISGAGGTNNITINRAGSDTINGATSQVISTDYGNLRFRRVSSGLWVIL